MLYNSVIHTIHTTEVPKLNSSSMAAKKKERNFKENRLIVSHLYFSFAESPLYFIGLLGLLFMGMSGIGIISIAIMKIAGFPLLTIPYYPVYVFIMGITGLLILIFSVVSAQIRDFQREMINMYGQMHKTESAISRKPGERKNVDGEHNHA